MMTAPLQPAELVPPPTAPNVWLAHRPEGSAVEIGVQWTEDPIWRVTALAVTTTDSRTTFPWAELTRPHVREAIETTREKLREHLGRPLLPIEQPKATGRRRYTDLHYRVVAELYNALIARGDLTPVHTIAQAAGVPTSTATGWITRARRMGMLTRYARPDFAEHARRGGDR